MKIVALNFGRAKAQTMSYLDHAIRAAEAAGAEVEVIQMINKDIGRCMSCGACSGGAFCGGRVAAVSLVKDRGERVFGGVGVNERLLHKVGHAVTGVRVFHHQDRGRQLW